MDKLFVGVEIGASKHQIYLMNSEFSVLKKDFGYVEIEKGAAGILEWMKEHIALLIEDCKEQVAAISVGFGGIIESATGTSVVSVQVEGWKDFNIVEWFEKTFNIKSFVLNDTVAGGFAEYYLGTGKGTKNFFYTNIGSGIGGVFFLDGEYYDGSGYGAAYFGHTYIPYWRGGYEKVENICSGFGIQRRLREPGYIPADSVLNQLCEGKIETVTTKMLGQAVAQGDKFALEELERIAGAYSIGMSNVTTLIHPEVISIGGGVANIGEPLLAPIRKHVDELVFISAKNKYSIVKCHFGDDAVPIGAVVYAAKMLSI